ncbi:type II secretion system protein N [Bordetella avium]|uniref:type II secretion system protein N n=1 Tax=Bordetella avium TaxID=521 RepID=UPI000E69AE2C|nr:type II secretion system protein N [Bordetella avium]RIQ18745.1 general secretion pathway protein GspC [Bordetella avium]RIQ35220.1 general secretion pathway protein GspC [Bordetella avium]RIQ72060.1 general secretion pathway protein GspC [Bordetella avium]
MRFALPVFPAPLAVRVLAACAAACALGVWGAILLAPAPSAMPAPLAAAPPPAADNQAVARWFGRDEALTSDVKILGVIAAGRHGSAVLSIDGGPPTAYRVGNALPGALVLRDIGADRVVLDQRGREMQLRTPSREAAPAGIVPLP